MGASRELFPLWGRGCYCDPAGVLCDLPDLLPPERPASGFGLRMTQMQFVPGQPTSKGRTKAPNPAEMGHCVGLWLRPLSFSKRDAKPR